MDRERVIQLLYRAPVITSHRSEMNYSVTCGKSRYTLRLDRVT